MIEWPAVIYHSGSPELILIRDESVLEKEVGQGGIYNELDQLIDACGRIYSLDARNKADVIPVDTGNVMPLADFLGLIKAHVAQTGACCVAKLYAPDYSEAFTIIASTQE